MSQCIHLPQLLYASKKITKQQQQQEKNKPGIRGWEYSLVVSACLAYMRPWVQSLERKQQQQQKTIYKAMSTIFLVKNEKKIKYSIVREHLHCSRIK
jgi:hypothetical protein